MHVMPGGPRHLTVDENEVGYYHCYNRSVGSSYFFGTDRTAMKNCHHRKDWLDDLLRECASAFAIDFAKYCIQDNHLHLLLRNRPDLALKWSKEEVLRR